MATFASDFNQYSVPTPTYGSAPGTSSQYDYFKSYGSTSGQDSVSNTAPSLQSIQGTLQKEAGLSSNIDPNLTQDALAGNIAQALRMRQQAQPSTYSPYGAQTQSLQASEPSAYDAYIAEQQRRYDRYTPEVLDQGYDKYSSYGVTNAGLEAPTLEKFGGDVDAYNQAADFYDRLKLSEQMQAAQSRAQQYADERNAQINAITQMNRVREAVEGEQKEIARKSSIERQALANRLAARGISENTDSWSQSQFAELDRLNREAQQAAAQAASISMQDTISAEQEKLRQSLYKRIEGIQAAQNNLARVQDERERNAQELMLIEQKKKDYESKIAEREGKLGIADRLASVKEQLTPAQIMSLLAGAGYKDAQSQFLSGAKTDLTNAQTDRTIAQTNRINTLLPAEKSRIEAQVKKLLTPPRSGTSGAAKGAAAGSAFMKLTDNLNADLASGKRDWGQTFDLVKGQYPTVSDDLINMALGGSYDPSTNTATGWAEPGAYESFKASTKSSSGSTADQLMNLYR